MLVSEVVQALSAVVLSGEDRLCENVYTAFSCDLMSDVLAFMKGQDVLLLTGLVNAQMIRTADLLDLWCILIVRGKVPTPDMVEMAKGMGMVLLRTDYTIYEASGILYARGLPAVEIKDTLKRDQYV